MTGAHTRRRRTCIATALTGLALAAFWAATHVPPRAELAARALTAWLGRPVAIGSLELRIRSGIELELEGLRVAAGPEAGPGAPALLEIASARGRQSWPRLLAGQLVPLSWELVEPVLHLRGGGGPAPRITIPEVDLAVRGGRIEWEREGSAPLVARDLMVQGRRGALGTQARGRASARQYSGDTLLCLMDVDFEGWLDEGTVSGSVADLDLGQLPLQPVPLQGRAGGRFALHRDGRETSLDLDVDIARFELRAPRLHGALRPQEARVEGRATWRDGALQIALRRLRLDDLDATGRLRVDPRPGGRTSGELSLAPFEPGPGERLHPLHVLARFAQSWEARNQRIAAGRVHDASLSWDVPTSELAAAFAFRRRLEPGELRIALRAEGGVYRPSEGAPPLEDISGSLEILGDTLHVSNLKLRQGQTLVPELDVRIEGMTQLVHLPADERHAPHGPGMPVPGISPLFSELAQRDTGGEPPAPLRLRDLELYHPAAVLPVREGRGQFLRRGAQIELDLEHAVVGGAPARLGVVWDRDAGRLAVDLRYEAGEMSVREPPPHWLASWVEIDHAALGGWAFDDLAGMIRVTGDRVELSELEGRMAGGPSTGRGEISLAHAAAAPFQIDFEVAGAKASAVAARLDLDPENVLGSFAARGRLEGQLDPDQRFLIRARLASDIELRDGSIGGLPLLVAIARLPSLRGAPAALLGRPLEYRSASAHVEIAETVLTITEGRLDGRDLGLLVDGQMQLGDPGQPGDFLVTLLFLRTVDELISQVPFLGTFVLGKDQSLLGASFRVQGPRDDTRVTPVPPEMLTRPTQWATGVISSGVRRLGRLVRLLPPAASSPEKTSDSTSADTRTQQDPGPP